MNVLKIKTLTALLLTAVLLCGCAGPAAVPAGPSPSPELTATPTPIVTASPVPTPSPSPTPLPTPRIENIKTNDEGHYTFNPYVFGSAFEKVFRPDQKQAFFAYCDALRAGEDTFPCPDAETHGWCVGVFSFFFSPVADRYVQWYSPDTTPPWENGTGRIFYTIPVEEFLEKQKAFEETITGILNDCLSDDYTDFEKILALYEYMCLNYTYDYDIYADLDKRSDEVSPYRTLNEKHGICSEIAALYNYLLLQVGIDSNEMGGLLDYGNGVYGEGHSWVYVKFNGECYHIDPTWGLDPDRAQLSYFMMNDKVREERDFFPPNHYTIASKGDETNKYFTLSSTDATYEPLWSGWYVGMDRKAKEIHYVDFEGKERIFKYAS